MTFLQMLDDYFAELTQADKFSGVVLITQGQNRLYERAFGLASRSWGIVNTLDIRFDTASITKLFTAVAILQLIDQGHLSFATSAVKFLELTDTTISPEVTIFHLLTDTSGIGDDVEEEDGENYEDLWVTKPNYSVIETARFSTPIHPQTAQLPARSGLPLLQLQLHPAGLDDRESDGIDLP